MGISVNSCSSEAIKTELTLLGDRKVILASTKQDAPAASLSSEDGLALAAAIRSAREQNLPFVGIIQTIGADIEGGATSADGWARAARELSLASGTIPTMMAACGPVVTGTALLLGLTDITIFTEDAYAFITGPKAVERYTGNPVDANNLGGNSTHARSTGLASLVVSSVEEALEAFEDILNYFPNSVNELPNILPTTDPSDRPTPEAAELIPTAAMGSYDVRDVITIIADDEEFLELKADWAPNLVTGFTSFGGYPVGIVANQTQALAGSIDIPASQKGARFVAMCDAFNIPLLTMVDTSGFLPGKDLEWRGMIRHGAQLAFAYARATVPRIGLILRKSYGGAYIVMDSRYMGNDLMFAWPTAEVAVMGAKGAVQILHRKASDEEKLELEQQYEDQYLTPYPAAERGSISSVINPADTRKEIASALELLNTKKEKLRPRKHDNGPL